MGGLVEAAAGEWKKKKKGKSDSLFPANPRDFLSTQNYGEN